MSFFERFMDYFQGIANSFEEEKYSTNIFPSASDKGTTREGILMEFFTNHLPIRCKVIRGGFIFDSDGNESKQLDLIIVNDLTLQFKQFDSENKEGKSFNLVQGCYAAISVKSNLQKDDIFDSLENLASIPPMPDMSGKIDPLLRFDRTIINNFPVKVVFGFKGLSLGRTLKHINKFYSSRDVPENRNADIIVLNNKFIIQRSGKKEKIMRDGTKIPPDSFYGYIGNFIGSYSLFFILTAIQSYANIGGHFIIDFQSILDKIPFE